MEKNQFSNLPTAELKKRANVLRIAVVFIGCAMVIMAISAILVSIRKGFNALFAGPFGFLPLFIVFWIQLKQMNTELKKREE